MWRAAAALAAALSVPVASVAGQLSASSEVQVALYPREPIGRPAIDNEVRGWVSLEYERPLRQAIDVSGDVVVYGSSRRRAVVDGEAALAWRGAKAALTAGLLRERWGRFTDSPLDLLGPTNTPFSLVDPELRLSQPTIRATALLDRLSVDAYALVGFRRQPLPEADGRLGFGIATTDVVRRGSMGDQAIGVRVSSTGVDIDWAAHVFGGLNRRPTFVPRLTPEAGLTAVDAVYTEILQVGGELETTRADWRFVAEGFGRRGGVDVTGRDRNYGFVAAAAEYQRLGAFGGAYNVIPRVELMVDTRGDRVDIPFASSVRAGIRVAQTRRLPLQVEGGYAYDYAFRGHGVMASAEKAVAESPALNLGFRLRAFSSGQKPSVLDVWRDDLEILGYVRIELSR